MAVMPAAVTRVEKQGFALKFDDEEHMLIDGSLEVLLFKGVIFGTLDAIMSEKRPASVAEPHFILKGHPPGAVTYMPGVGSGKTGV